MQKRRPLGISILSIWALAGSGAMFVLGAIYLASYSSATADIIKMSLGPLAMPLGGTYAINSYAALPVAAFFAIVGVYTLKGRKWTWFASVGMSLAALVQGIFVTYLWLYNTLNGSQTLLLGLSSSETLLIQTTLNAVIFSTIGLRLYYLFQPHVQDFFDQKSLNVQKRVA